VVGVLWAYFVKKWVFFKSFGSLGAKVQILVVQGLFEE
jgi:intracellular septation protein A